MPVLAPQHDFGHAIEADPHWSESWYFNAYDPAADVGFFTRIGLRPHAPSIDGFLTLWLPDGDTATLRETRSADLPDPDAPALGVLAYRRVEPMRCWDLAAAGTTEDGRAVELEARFEALAPALGVDGARRATGAGKAAVASLAAGHFEQAGRWQGTLSVAGRAMAFAGRGNRDKSWGPRRTDGGGGMAWWRWFSANFGDDVHLGAIRIGTEAGTLARGWAWRSGEALAVRELEVETDYAEDGPQQRALRLRATDKAGAQHRLSGEVLRTVRLHALGHEHAAIFEGLTRWRWGDLTGYGICEYAHALDPAGEPQRADT